MPDTPQTSAHPEPPEGSIALPAFTPVPRAKDRHNGWKPEVQRRFIEALAETGSVKAACRRVGRADHGAYLLRRHPEAASFRAAWDAALDLGIRRIEDAAMDRALYGVEETYHYHGQLVGRRRRYNERLVMFMLRNRAPHRFAEGGGARGLNAVDGHRLARLRKAWRAEWEREKFDEEEARRQSESSMIDTIDGMIEKIRQNRLKNDSPRARAAHEAVERAQAEYRRIREEDGLSWMDGEFGDDGEDDEPPRLGPPAEG